MKTEDTEALGRQRANQARSKPDTVDRPVRTAHTFVHHYNSTQYGNTITVFSIFPFLQAIQKLGTTVQPTAVCNAIDYQNLSNSIVLCPHRLYTARSGYIVLPCLSCCSGSCPMPIPAQAGTLVSKLVVGQLPCEQVHSCVNMDTHTGGQVHSHTKKQ